MNILNVANNAYQYARMNIIKGRTHISNNTLENEQRDSLEKALEDLHGQIKLEVINLKAEDQNIALFYSVVEQCKKFSLGNCHELRTITKCVIGAQGRNRTGMVLP